MTKAPTRNVTLLLQQAQDGHTDAIGELFSLVYEELHAVAVRRMRNESPGHLLQPTALVNETYMRLFGTHPARLADRKHFFSVAAAAMGRILIDSSRAERASKRGGRPQRVTVKSFMQIAPASADELVRIEEAIAQLAATDQRAAEVLKLSYFGGCNTEQIAEFFNVSQRTVQRDLNVAQAFLERLLRSDGSHA
jgi:RNA polymerase sigma factor (TIGR02999 family)